MKTEDFQKIGVVARDAAKTFSADTLTGMALIILLRSEGFEIVRANPEALPVVKEDGE